MLKKAFMIVSAAAAVCLFSFKGDDERPGRPQKPPLKTIIIDPGHGGIDVGAGGDFSREAVVALEIGLRLRDILQKELPGVNVLITRERDELPGNATNKNAALIWRSDFANRNAGDLFIAIHLNSVAANKQFAYRTIGTRMETRTYYTGKGKNKKKVTKEVEVPVRERYRLPAKAWGTQTYVLASDWYNQKKKIMFGADKLLQPEDTVDMGLLDLDPAEARIRASEYAKHYFTKSITLATYCEQEFAQIGRNSWGVKQRDWEGISVLQRTQMPSILVETGFIDCQDEEKYLNSDQGQDEMANAIMRAVKRYKDMLENPQKYANGVDTSAAH